MRKGNRYRAEAGHIWKGDTLPDWTYFVQVLQRITGSPRLEFRRHCGENPGSGNAKCENQRRPLNQQLMYEESATMRNERRI